MVPYSFRLRAISQEVLINLICNMCLKTALLKLLLHIPGAKELMSTVWYKTKFGSQILATKFGFVPDWSIVLTPQLKLKHSI